MAQQKLWCQPGEHFWTREATRGRKPIACEEHRATVLPAPEAEYLYCVIQTDTLYGETEEGNRLQLVNGPDFNPGDQGMAEKQDGRWYFVLFEAAPPPQDEGVPPSPSLSDPLVQTLTCKEGGHTWTRPAQRGRRPEYCPEHRPQPVRSVRDPGESDSAYRQRRRKEEIEKRKELELATHQEEAQAEYATIQARIKHASDEYQAAIKKACKATAVSEIQQAFDIADRKQGSLLNCLARERHLAKILSK